MRLFEAAHRRWRSACPCCGTTMREGRLKKNVRMPRHQMSRGHDHPVGRGGDPTVWLHMCHGCNNDQGFLTFAGFARMLLLREDRRAERVVEVARFVEEWRKS